MIMLKLAAGLMLILCCLFIIGGFINLIKILPEGDVDNKLAGEKYRRRVNSRMR